MARSCIASTIRPSATRTLGWPSSRRRPGSTRSASRKPSPRARTAGSIACTWVTCRGRPCRCRRAARRARRWRCRSRAAARRRGRMWRCPRTVTIGLRSLRRTSAARRRRRSTCASAVRRRRRRRPMRAAPCALRIRRARPASSPSLRAFATSSPPRRARRWSCAQWRWGCVRRSTRPLRSCAPTAACSRATTTRAAPPATATCASPCRRTATTRSWCATAWAGLRPSTSSASKPDRGRARRLRGSWSRAARRRSSTCPRAALSA